MRFWYGHAMIEIPKLPPRDVDAHKGSFGRVLLVGGSRGMAGSIALSAMAAMRSGAGLGHVAVPDVILETVAAFEPCVMTHGLEHDLDGRLVLSALEDILAAAEGKDAVGIGPGFSRTGQAGALGRELVRSITAPMVVDADALFGLAENLSALKSAAGPRVLTPHPGEFSRLSGSSISGEPADRRQAAEAFASRFENVVLVLKGAGTIVTDGERTFVNETGNAGMATAGSGDVLTGIITALIGQGMEPCEAAVLGVHAHGAAGDLLATSHGQVGLIASDLVEALPRVWMAMESA